MLTEKDYCDKDLSLALKEAGYIGQGRCYYDLDKEPHKLLNNNMKQHTNKDQTAKLIELGFPKPSPKYIHIGDVSYDSNHNYSIGELIEFLPLELEPHPDMTRRTIVGNEVLFCDEYIDWIELRFNKHEEIIDNLFDACVTLKEEGVI